MKNTLTDRWNYSHEAMATEFSVHIAGVEERRAGQCAGAVFREIDRLERLLSRHDACSDVAQVNRLKPGESLRVAPDVFECLSAAGWVYAGTGGAFDVTVGPLLKRPEYVPESDLSPGMVRELVGMRRLSLRTEDYSVHISEDTGTRSGVEIDLGAIGKGFAIDKAADILESLEVGNYLLNAGCSTVLASGDGSPGGGWVVGVGGDWGAAAGIEELRLVNESLSGSGTEVKGEHIFDPATGAPARNHLAAWSVCPSATVADALSTAFMIMPTDRVRAFCAGHPAIGAFVVEPDGRLVGVPKSEVAV